MISPWHVGEEPHEDAEGVVHFFMASLFDICPHVSLGEATADIVRYPVDDLRRENAAAKTAEWYREYGVVHVQRHPDVWRNAGYHWAPRAENNKLRPGGVSRDGFSYVTIVSPLLDDLILWPEEVLEPMKADTPHNRKSLLRVETLLQVEIMRRATRRYNPRDIRMTFNGQELRDYDVEEFVDMPDSPRDQVDAALHAWRELNSRTR